MAVTMPQDTSAQPPAVCSAYVAKQGVHPDHRSASRGTPAPNCFISAPGLAEMLARGAVTEGATQNRTGSCHLFRSTKNPATFPDAYAKKPPALFVAGHTVVSARRLIYVRRNAAAPTPIARGDRISQKHQGRSVIRDRDQAASEHEVPSLSPCWLSLACRRRRGMPPSKDHENCHTLYTP